MFFMTEMVGDGQDAVALKCIDWLDQGPGPMVAGLPEGYEEPQKVLYGAFFTWNKDSYGMGWTPQFFFEPMPYFDAAGGVEKWRQAMLEMSKPDSPCQSCMTELNYLPHSNHLYTFDMMCGAPRKKQDACSDFT